MSDNAALCTVIFLVSTFFAAEGWAGYCRYRRNAWKRRGRERYLPKHWKPSAEGEK